MKTIIYLLLAVFMAAFSVRAHGVAWAAVTDMPEETDAVQAFSKGAIVVKGEGAAPDKAMGQAQKRIMALRAAKVVALREAAEIMDGVAITAETTVKEAAADSDVVRTTVEGLVKGAQVVKEVYDPLSGMAVVYVSVPMPGVAGALLPEVASYAPALPPFSPAAGASALAGYDGLIVDARGTGFKPALLNRIVTPNGEVVYDPARVAQNILVTRGAAGYTSDLGKARALLGDRGSSNPLVVKAGKSQRATDAELGAVDAGAVFSSNQSGNYLEAARVVFVLD